MRKIRRGNDGIEWSMALLIVHCKRQSDQFPKFRYFGHVMSSLRKTNLNHETRDCCFDILSTGFFSFGDQFKVLGLVVFDVSITRYGTKMIFEKDSNASVPL